MIFAQARTTQILPQHSLLKWCGFYQNPYNKECIMRLILAILIPWLLFFTIGRPFAGILCLILQLTLIGWLPAAIWAAYALSQYKTDKKIQEALGS